MNLVRKRKVIFIGGSSYSGSTMLDMMLANAEDGFSVGEVYALFYPYRPHHFHPSCGCGDPNCHLWLKLRKGGAKNLYRNLFKMFPHIHFIVDSSKNPWWMKRQILYLENQGFDVYNLLIWKDPAAFAYSMIKRKRKGWVRAWISYYRLYLTLFSDYICVSYAQLAREPVNTLKRLCERVGIHYFVGKEYFWEKQHHTLFGNISAKIHMHDLSDFDSMIERNSKYDCVDTPRHRSIYYDVSYLKKMPKESINEIEDNLLIQQIKLLLTASTENGRRDLSTIVKRVQLTHAELHVARAKHLMKKIIGLLMGRYIRLF